MPSEWTPDSVTADAVYLAGFKYDPNQDIIYSRMDAWQRKFGYTYAYDVAAPATISAIIDCEPFFFHYDGKDWMIELWKGQYGLETGGEIGVYVSNLSRPILDLTLGNRPYDLENSKFFDCADNKERLKMSFNLNRNGERLFHRESEAHWWLTGFKWGVLSTPEELTMDLNITFPGKEMREAFISAAEKLGYKNIDVVGEAVGLTFDKPFSPQPRFDPKWQQFIKQVQTNNSQIVDKYKKLNLSSNDPNKIPDEIAVHFDFYKPKNFIKQLTNVLPDRGYSEKEVVKALEHIFGRSSNPLVKLLDGLINFFKKLFGKQRLLVSDTN